MSVSGIGTAGYPVTGYTIKRTQQNAAGKSFADQVNNAAGKKVTLSI